MTEALTKGIIAIGDRRRAGRLAEKGVCWSQLRREAKSKQSLGGKFTAKCKKPSFDGTM